MNHSAWDIGFVPQYQVQDEVFGANADTLVCGSLAPAGTAVAVDGGCGYPAAGATSRVRCTRSGLCSGSTSSTRPGPSSKRRSLPMPAADYTVRDTWFTAGMRGSGSNTLTAEEVFSPAHRVVHGPV